MTEWASKLDIRMLLEGAEVQAQTENVLLNHAERQLIGTDVLVPELTPVRRWGARRARISSVTYFNQQMHVMLQVYRLDGKGFLNDPALTTFLPLRLVRPA